MPWTVIVPVKPSAVGKSRLGRGAGIARAIAMDTIAATIAATVTAATEAGDLQVIVVTADPLVADEAAALGAHVVRESHPAGLAAAIASGLAAAGKGPDDPTIARAVLLGDLPALRPAELAAALSSASAYPRAFVPDAEGTGSTLVTANAGSAFVHFFGRDSAQHHLDAGLIALELPATSTLRRDVDVEEHLDQAMLAGLGPRTAAMLSAR
jgi:2-phospho-L-lactate guanylyltransferase